LKCPYCEFSGRRMDLHAHLVEEHPEGIDIELDEAQGKPCFRMCPLCSETVTQPLRKRASVLEEHKREIRMVAFDLLLYHLEGKHEEEPTEPA